MAHNTGKKLLKPTKEGQRKIPASLRQKMAQATSPARPSLVPAGLGTAYIPRPKQGKEKEVKPSIDDLLPEGEDRRELRTLVIEQAKLANQVRQPLKDKKLLEIRIKTLLDGYGIEAMDCEGLPVMYFNSGRSTIDGTLLLAAGVTQETITLCTRESKGKTLKIGKAEED